MALRDRILADRTRTFLRTDHFAEPVVLHTPAGDVAVSAALWNEAVVPGPQDRLADGEHTRPRDATVDLLAESLPADPLACQVSRPALPDERWQVVRVCRPAGGLATQVLHLADAQALQARDGYVRLIS